MTEESDSRLLEMALQGDEQAFRVLYSRHRDAVFRFSYRLLGLPGLAEDVTHDCFLSLLQRAASFDARRASTALYAVEVWEARELVHSEEARLPVIAW
jgi:RNA polymerase sigma-70 factor, ECF subfamily